jgi:hypothetical protein
VSQPAGDVANLSPDLIGERMRPGQHVFELTLVTLATGHRVVDPAEGGRGQFASATTDNRRIVETVTPNQIGTSDPGVTAVRGHWIDAPVDRP